MWGRPIPSLQPADVNHMILQDIHLFLYITYFHMFQIKYKEEWEKTKSRACDIGVNDLSVKAAKASRDLASDVRKHASSSTAQRTQGWSDWSDTFNRVSD